MLDEGVVGGDQPRALRAVPQVHPVTVDDHLPPSTPHALCLLLCMGMPVVRCCKPGEAPQDPFSSPGQGVMPTDSAALQNLGCAGTLTFCKKGMRLEGGGVPGRRSGSARLP